MWKLSAMPMCLVWTLPVIIETFHSGANVHKLLSPCISLDVQGNAKHNNASFEEIVNWKENCMGGVPYYVMLSQSKVHSHYVTM